MFYSLFVYGTTRKNTQRYCTTKRVIRCIYCTVLANQRQVRLTAAVRENEPALLPVNSLSPGGPLETGPHKR